MNLFKTLLIFSCCCFCTTLPAQKQLIKKANGFYKNNQYKDAIDLYEQALQEKDNLPASTHLAYCYRMTNQMVKAEEWYAKVVENEKAKPITYFYYAESLMSNGKYDLAKNWFLKYNEKEPDDKNAIRMAYACDKVKTLEPYFKNVEVQAFEHNSDVDESSPLYFNDGIVFTSDRSSGPNPLKQKSGWTGRDYQRIYYSSRKSDGHYADPINFSKKLNDLNKHCGPVSFTKDKKTVIFTRTGQDAGKNNSYNIQLFSAQSEDGKKWKNVELLSFCNKEYNYMHPAISSDGTQLFFISDKPGGLGGTDIYWSKKKGDGWSRPQNLGPIINTPANEAFPFYHESEKLFFCSKGHLSFGGFDILFSNLKEDGTWQKPVNVGKPINSSYDDISISLDESLESGLFSSSRDGGDDDIYIFKILEGTNAELESLDFEGIVENGSPSETIEEVNIEGLSESTNTVNQTPEPEMPTSAPVVDAVVEERPIKNIEGTIKNSEALEVVREEPTTLETVPEPVESEAFVKSDKLQPDPIITEVVEEVIEEPIVRSVPNEISTPDRKVEILDAPPMEEVEANEMNKVEEIVDNSSKVSPEVNQETPGIEKVERPLVKTEAVKKTQSPKQVNLIIPSRKKENPNPEVVEKASSEKIAILDRDPVESKPPVMIGDKSSPLSEEVMELPRLAELLETNQVIPQKGFVVNGLNYETGSYLLSTEGTKSLVVVVDLLNRYPDLKIEIGSHTSALGDDVDNHNLSRKRAMSIMAFLVYKGISNERVTAKGYGETQLQNSCSNGVNCSMMEHAENDRVEVKVRE